MRKVVVVVVEITVIISTISSDCSIRLSFQFQFVNSFLSLFYIAFYLQDQARLKEVHYNKLKNFFGFVFIQVTNFGLSAIGSAVNIAAGDW